MKKKEEERKREREIMGERERGERASLFSSSLFIFSFLN